MQRGPRRLGRLRGGLVALRLGLAAHLRPALVEVRVGLGAAHASLELLPDLERARAPVLDQLHARLRPLQGDPRIARAAVRDLDALRVLAEPHVDLVERIENGFVLFERSQPHGRAAGGGGAGGGFGAQVVIAAMAKPTTATVGNPTSTTPGKPGTAKPRHASTAVMRNASQPNLVLCFWAAAQRAAHALQYGMANVRVTVPRTARDCRRLAFNVVCFGARHDAQLAGMVKVLDCRTTSRPPGPCACHAPPGCGDAGDAYPAGPEADPMGMGPMGGPPGPCGPPGGIGPSPDQTPETPCGVEPCPDQPPETPCGVEPCPDQPPETPRGVEPCPDHAPGAMPWYQ